MDNGRRGSGFLAVTVVTGIAVVAVSGVVAWARISAGQVADIPRPGPLDEPVPTELAGGFEPGEVPAPVADAFDEPIVVARFLDDVPPDAGACDFHDVRWLEEPELEFVLVTPEGMFLSLVGEGEFFVGEGEFLGPPAERLRVTCDMTWDGERWLPGGVSSGPVGDRFGGRSGWSCCDQQGLATASADVAVPDGAAWALQERGGWWLAYPVESLTRVSLTWKAHQPRFGRSGPTPSYVVFLDAGGTQVSEVFVGA